MTRARLRFAPASAALLVQIALVALFAHSVAPGTPRQTVREVMTLLPILHTMQAPPPVPPRVPRMIVPQVAATLPPILNDKAVRMTAAMPPSALEGIGRALFGCAPERYGQLTGPEQLRCPAPGQAAQHSVGAGMADMPESQSRDALLWAENLAAREFMPACSDPGAGNGVSSERVGRCVMRQTLDQSLRARQVKAQVDYARARRPAEPIWVGLVPRKR